MKQIIFGLVLVFGFAFSVFAQNQNSLCPTLYLSGGGVFKEHSPLTFTLVADNKIENFDVRYEWKASQGAIIKGQGTPAVTIDTIGLPGGSNITVQLKFTGLPENCQNIVENTASILPKLIGEPYDIYPKISIADEYGRFDSFIFSLRDNPNSKGFLVMNVAKNESLEKTKTRIRKLLRVANIRKFPKERLIFAVKKTSYISQTIAWIVPKDAEFPNCDGCRIINGKDL